MIDEAHEWTDSVIDDLEYQLRLQYSEATAEMLDKQAEWLKDYERQKAQYDKDLKEGRITKEEYRKFMQTKAMQSQWFTNMVDSLADGAYAADVRAMDAVNDAMPKVYAENYNYGGYQVENGLHIKTSFNLADESTVRTLLKDNPDLLPKKYIDKAKDIQWNKEKFNSAILQGIIQGEPLTDIADRISSVLAMDRRAAYRNARTAMTAAQNVGRLQSYIRMLRNGIHVKKEWIATLDHHTRSSHRKEDNDVRELDERFKETGLLYPGDPSTNDPGNVINCRCTMVANFDDVPHDISDRFSRLDDMSYEEWKQSKPKYNKSKSTKKSTKKKSTEKQSEKKDTKQEKKYTATQINKMTRKELIPLAREAFAKSSVNNGLSQSEINRRFDALVDDNTNEELRKLIKRWL